MNRHNFGYMVLEQAARDWKLEFNVLECRTLASRTKRFSEEILLAKPLTFMNAAGNAAGLLLNKYNLHAEDFVVVYDDIDLPLGTIRIRRGGGAGFHKGVISVIETLGTEEFPRLRLGINGEKEYGDLAEYVLSDFDQKEITVVNEVTSLSVQALERMLSDGLESAMRSFNMRYKETQKISETESAQ